MTDAAPKTSWRLLPMHRNWRVALVVSIVMVLLTLVGVGLTTADRAFAPKYWMFLVPVYGLLCIGTAWSRSSAGDGGKVEIVRQIFHWLIISFAMWFNFFICRSGEETGSATGDIELLLLATGCLLAGVHLEVMFTLVGLLLMLTLVLVIRAEQYLWVTFVVGLIAIALIAGLWLVFAKRTRSATT